MNYSGTDAAGCKTAGASETDGTNELKKKTIQLTSQLTEEERASVSNMTWISPRWVWVISSGTISGTTESSPEIPATAGAVERDSEQKGTYNTDDYRKAEQA